MKAGIVTFHAVHNYGACLQAYALQTTISERVEEVEIIDYRPLSVVSQYSTFNISEYRRLKSTPKVLIRKILSDIAYAKNNRQRKKAFNNFFDTYYFMTGQRFCTSEEVQAKKFDYDICFTGSDQVWNADITAGPDPIYFLDFNRESGMSRVSYAASIGRAEIDKKYEYDYRKYLNGLDSISVREETGCRVLRQFAGKRIRNVLDPTLLLTAERWQEAVRNRKILNEKYIFVYSLYGDENLISLVNDLSGRTNMKVVTTLARKVFCNELRRFPCVAPDEFVSLLANASFVVTNSFHGTAFSVNFSKDFYVVPGGERSSRIVDFLSCIGLSDRIIEKYSGEDISNESIEYAAPQKRLSELRRESLAYIDDAIRSLKEKYDTFFEREVRV